MRADCRSAPPSSALMPAWAAPRQTRLSVLTSRLAQTYHSANCSSEFGAGLSTIAKVRASGSSGAGETTALSATTPVADLVRLLEQRLPGAAEPGSRPTAASTWSAQAGDRLRRPGRFCRPD